MFLQRFPMDRREFHRHPVEIDRIARAFQIDLEFIQLVVEKNARFIVEKLELDIGEGFQCVTDGRFVRRFVDTVNRFHLGIDRDHHDVLWFAIAKKHGETVLKCFKPFGHRTGTQIVRNAPIDQMDIRMVFVIHVTLHALLQFEDASIRIPDSHEVCKKRILFDMALPGVTFEDHRCEHDGNGGRGRHCPGDLQIHQISTDQVKVKLNE